MHAVTQGVVQSVAPMPQVYFIFLKTGTLRQEELISFLASYPAAAFEIEGAYGVTTIRSRRT
jgi:hypothetical protein